MASNLQIDWKQGTLQVQRLERETIEKQCQQPVNVEQVPTPVLENLWSHISIINVTTYERLCQKKGNTTFQINLVLEQKNSARASCINPLDVDLSNILHDYHQFADVFSKQGAKKLPQHCLFDLSIQIESEKKLSLGLIYSLSSLELQTLQDFINENLKSGLIRPS